MNDPSRRVVLTVVAAVDPRGTTTIEIPSSQSPHDQLGTRHHHLRRIVHCLVKLSRRRRLDCAYATNLYYYYS